MTPKRILVACEYSGTVRDAFIRAGHWAMSCDLLPTDAPGPHYQGDVFDVLGDGWDLMIAHPPCTFMSNSGAKHLYIDGRKENGPDPERWAALEDAARFFRALYDAPIPRIAVENPVMLGHAKRLIGVPQTQVIHPWQHGHGESKSTCLWLRGLPPLLPTDEVDGREQRMWKMGPSPDRWKLRSATYPGIAAAMAAQWGPLLDQPPTAEQTALL